MSCPGEEQLRTLLDGSCAAEQAESLTAHLDACAGCRKLLDRLAGVSDSWAAVAKGLESGKPLSSPDLQQAMAELRRAEPSGVAEGETLAPEQGAPVDPVADVKLGHYEVRGLVGEGGMGKVYRAFDEGLHRVVAIKVMADSLAASGPARQRFLREARAAAAVVHEHVVLVHEVNDSGAVPYLVMQFVSGQSLQDRIDRGGPLPLKEILRIGMQTAAGLAAAHKQGLVHRDVKPANILLENGVERVKLTDFGLARAADDASLTQSGVIAGTPQYMSPEQANGEHVDHRSDLFSLGSVMYAMATGHPPFRASNTMGVLKRVCEETPRPIREVDPEIPRWLEKIVAKLMAKDAGKRYQSAEEVAGVLAERLAKLQLTDAPAGGRLRSLIPQTEEVTASEVTPARRKKKQKKLAQAVSGAVVLALVLAVLVSGLLSPPSVFVKMEVNDTTQDGWVQLFNGKDLTGWRKHDGDSNWRVEGDVLVGSGPVPAGGRPATNLTTERGDFADFHLRVKARVRSEHADSGVLCRVDPGVWDSFFADHAGLWGEVMP